MTKTTCVLTQIRMLQTCVVLLFALSGCATIPEPSISIVSTQEASFHGRVFVMQELTGGVEGADFQTLQVTGDGVAISFNVPGGPLTPEIVGNTISYGNHTIEPQPTRNEFIIDGTAFTLPAPGFYAFSKGEFLFRLR